MPGIHPLTSIVLAGSFAQLNPRSNEDPPRSTGHDSRSRLTVLSLALVALPQISLPYDVCKYNEKAVLGEEGTLIFAPHTVVNQITSTKRK